VKKVWKNTTLEKKKGAGCKSPRQEDYHEEERVTRVELFLNICERMV